MPKPIKTLTAAEAHEMLTKNPSLTLIDVREEAEYKSIHIEQALLIPLQKIHMQSIPSTSNTVILYCRLGQRSLKAAEKLKLEDKNLDIYTMEGGIHAWEKMGYPVNKKKSLPIPLDQQTQIAAGCLVFSGTVLGSWVSPWWHTLSGCVGAGLIFAGLSGYCGMAKILSRMPWNQ